MNGRNVFSAITVLLLIAAAIYLANARMPIDPTEQKPPATSTLWAAPVLNTVTVSPTMMGGEGGWYSDMPTAVPVKPRNVPAETATPTLTVTPHP